MVLNTFRGRGSGGLVGRAGAERVKGNIRSACRCRVSTTGRSSRVCLVNVLQIPGLGVLSPQSNPLIGSPPGGQSSLTPQELQALFQQQIQYLLMRQSTATHGNQTPFFFQNQVKRVG